MFGQESVLGAASKAGSPGVPDFLVKAVQKVLLPANGLLQLLLTHLVDVFADVQAHKVHFLPAALLRLLRLHRAVQWRLHRQQLSVLIYPELIGRSHKLLIRCLVFERALRV